MIVVIFMCSIHFANAYNPPLFSLQRSFTFTHTTNGVKTNIDQTSSEDSITEDRKTSLFGYTMVTRSNIKNQQIVIISAPGRKPAGKTNGGDFFKCIIEASQISCETLLNDRVRNKIGIETEHVPFLFGATMIRSHLNYILVCQTHQVNDIGHFKNCHCFVDTRDEYKPENRCFLLNYHTDVPIPFLNIFQIKVVRSKKWVLLGSRHFPGELDIPPQNGKEATKLALYSGIASWNRDTSINNHPRFFIPATTNKEWIPTIGFATGRLFPLHSEALVVATNDDDKHSGKLFFYDLPIQLSDTEPGLTIFDPAWQAFTNFGNKIVVSDINNDDNNDLIVTSPTSKWLDIPEVGHVHLFINTKSDIPFTSESIIIRGLPIAHSFFGWNADAIEDLDGDGFNDFLIAALKVSEEDLKGGIYVFLGGNESVIRGLTYYEIIRPSTSVENELTGFGFFISEKMVLDRQGNKYILISRILSGEVDIFKITPRSPIKVTVDIDPNNFEINEDFYLSLLDRELINPQITIRFKNIQEPVDATIKLSFKHSPNYHSFNQDYFLETFATQRKLVDGLDDQYTLYLRASNEKFSLIWILRAEITVTKSSQDPNLNQPIILFSQIFNREISFTKNCLLNDCIEDYSVVYTQDPIWIQNRDYPIYFKLRLANRGDFLTHLIIDVSLSMACKIKIPKREFIQVLQPNEDSLDPTKPQSRFIYNHHTPRHDLFDFIVRVDCPQVLVAIPDLVLKLSTQSFLSRDTNHFEFRSHKKFKHEFIIEAKQKPAISKHVCAGSKTEENIEFNVELFIGGIHYDNDLLYSAILTLEESAQSNVVSISITSKDCDVIMDKDLSRPSNDKATQNFRIQKDDNSHKIRLIITCKMMYKTSKLYLSTIKAFHTTLKIEPVIQKSSTYTLNSIMAYDAEYIVMVSHIYCNNEFIIILAVSLGCCCLIIVCSIVIYKIFFYKKVIKPPVDVTYLVQNTENSTIDNCPGENISTKISD